ncbi:type 1 glutamine amidotransferase [Nakamurella deserti]|uniref:type 1 glutamine amidotransferase n=1 Tax=Nakamurella deserti TaxID=2164074 RepID=UPI000DBE8E78|nr:type 1 glutamine amidotransferase [Nakamurella deserti]
MSTILVIEHDPSDPLLRLGEWLTDAGATVEVRRPYAGDTVPEDTAAFDAVISLGGEMGAHDDSAAPWLPATRRLLARSVAARTPTLGICLGAQLLAAAGGGIVTRGENGPERGAYLTARRDAAEHDPLFRDLPLTPDVMHYHDDVVSVLPPGATLLLSSPGYPHQAWRQGDAAWAVQFHIETGADDLRAWAASDDLPMTGRFGPMLDEAAETMALVWRDVAVRFVALADAYAAARRDGAGGAP